MRLTAFVIVFGIWSSDLGIASETGETLIITSKEELGKLPLDEKIIEIKPVRTLANKCEEQVCITVTIENDLSMPLCVEEDYLPASRRMFFSLFEVYDAATGARAKYIGPNYFVYPTKAPRSRLMYHISPGATLKHDVRFYSDYDLVKGNSYRYEYYAPAYFCEGQIDGEDHFLLKGEGKIDAEDLET